MTFAAITTIREAMILLFGGSMFIPLLIVGVIIGILLAVRGGKVLVVLILTPMLSTMILYGTGEFWNWTVDATWISVVMWMAMGIITAGAFWAIMR